MRRFKYKIKKENDGAWHVYFVLRGKVAPKPILRTWTWGDALIFAQLHHHHLLKGLPQIK